MTDTQLSRRTVVGAAWSVPVILVATAAPAAAASVEQPPVCIDPVGLVVRPVTGMPWQENQGNGFTLVKGDAILVGNDGPFDEITVTVTLWTSAGQEGLRLVGISGDTLLEAPKDGNRASLDILVRDLRVLKVVAPEKDASAHLIVGCSRGFVLKSSR